MGGWGIIAADVIVMANLAQIAGSYSFTFVGDLGWTSAADLPSSTLWSTVAGVIWIVVMTYICYRGIEVSARLQYVLLGIEVVMLVVFAVYRAGQGLLRQRARRVAAPVAVAGSGPAVSSFGTVIATAILIAVFIYWGWDTAVAVQRGVRRPGHDPGPGGGHLDVPAAGHLRPRHRRRGGLRRRRRRPASGWATRTTPTTCSPRSGHAVFGDSVLGRIIGPAAAVGSC